MLEFFFFFFFFSEFPNCDSCLRNHRRETTRLPACKFVGNAPFTHDLSIGHGLYLKDCRLRITIHLSVGVQTTVAMQKFWTYTDMGYLHSNYTDKLGNVAFVLSISQNTRNKKRETIS